MIIIDILPLICRPNVCGSSWNKLTWLLSSWMLYSAQLFRMSLSEGLQLFRSLPVGLRQLHMDYFFTVIFWMTWCCFFFLFLVVLLLLFQFCSLCVVFFVCFFLLVFDHINYHASLLRKKILKGIVSVKIWILCDFIPCCLFVNASFPCGRLFAELTSAD